MCSSSVRRPKQRHDPLQAAHVVGTLLGHTGNVNCVCWIPNSYFEPQAVVDFNGPALLASGSADNSVHVWLWGPPSGQPWDLLATLKVTHSCRVTAVRPTHYLGRCEQDVPLVVRMCLPQH